MAVTRLKPANLITNYYLSPVFAAGVVQIMIFGVFTLCSIMNFFYLRLYGV
jgi:hypothetical protein